MADSSKRALDKDTSGATRFEYDFSYMPDEIQAHTRAIGDWLQNFVEGCFVYEATKDEILGRLQELQGNSDFEFPVFAFCQNGDILPSWNRYQFVRANFGEVVEDPNLPPEEREKKAIRYRSFPVEIPFEIYMVTNSERHVHIWTHLLSVHFWKRPSLRVILPHWNLKVWAQFEITGLRFDRRQDDSKSLMIFSTCSCRLKSYFRERTETPRTLKIYTEYNNAYSKEALDDQIVDENGDVGSLNSKVFFNGEDNETNSETD